MAIPKGVDLAAQLEINLLSWTGFIPTDVFEGLTVTGTSFEIVDFDQALIMERVFWGRNSKDVAFVDIAKDPLLASSIVQVVVLQPGSYEGMRPTELFTLAKAAQHKDLLAWLEAHKAEELVPSLCMYSMPKIGLQLQAGASRLVLELGSWTAIHEASDVGRKELNYGIRPFGTDLSGQAATRIKMYEDRIDFWEAVAEAADISSLPNVICGEWFSGVVERAALSFERKVCKRIGRADCLMVSLDLEGQHNDNWCVPASISMALKFFGETNFSHEYIADHLDLTAQGGDSVILPPEGEAKVVTFLMSKDIGLLAKNEAPTKAEFACALDGDNPIVSLINGHARLAVGSSSLSVILGKFSLDLFGLVIFDPWPVKHGRILHWENEEAYKYVSSVVVDQSVREQSSASLNKAIRFLNKAWHDFESILQGAVAITLGYFKR